MTRAVPESARSRQVGNQLGGSGGVEHRQRLVEDEDGRPPGHDRGQGQLLLLSAGQGLGRPFAQRLQAKAVQGGLQRLADGRRRQAQVLQAKDDLFFHRLAEHLRRRILKDQPGALGQTPQGGGDSVQAVEPDVAFEGAPVQVGDQSGQAAGQRALAAARWPADEQALPRLHGQGDGRQALAALGLWIAIGDRLSLEDAGHGFPRFLGQSSLRGCQQSPAHSTTAMGWPFRRAGRSLSVCTRPVVTGWPSRVCTAAMPASRSADTG